MTMDTGHELKHEDYLHTYDVFEDIGKESAKLNMSDMDVYCAWRMGVAAYTAIRQLGGELPHDPKKSEPAKSIFVREYLWRNPNNNDLRISVIQKIPEHHTPKQIGEHSNFVRWIDHDWREIKA